MVDDGWAAAMVDDLDGRGDVMDLVAPRPRCSAPSSNARTPSPTSGSFRCSGGRILTHARVGLHSTFLSDDGIRSAHLTPIDDIARAVEEECPVGPDGRACVLPEGPQTIAYVAAGVVG